MALGKACPSACFDALPADGRVAINELIAAVQRALNGCSVGGGGGQGQSGLTVTVDVGTASGLPGAAVSVPISVSGGWWLVAGAQVDVLFDEAILSVDNPETSCTLASRLEGTQSVAASFPITLPAPPGQRRLRVIVTPVFGAVVPFGDGEIASCTFTISASATPGTYPLQADEVATSDAAGNGFTTVPNHGA